MYFENPTYLWSLLGVLIPIGIHLWSRREARTIRVGSIELLEASDSARSRAIRPNEWWLLALRILIVSLLALVLSGPRVRQPSPREGLVYIIEPSLITDGAPIDLTGPEGEAPQVRLLQKGLPVWDPEDTPPVPEETPGYWQLVPELRTLSADSIVVYTRGYVSGARSRRIPSPAHVHWVVVPNRDRWEKALLARGDQDTIALYTMRSGGEETTFERRFIPASEGTYTLTEGRDSILLRMGRGELIPLQPKGSLQVGLYAQPGFEPEVAYMEAAIRAVSRYLDQEIILTKGPALSDGMASESDLSIWLSEAPPPPAAQGVLYFQPDSLAGRLIIPGGKKGRYRLTDRLDLGNAVTGHLPEQLLQLLLNPAQWDEAIRKADRRQWEAAILGIPGAGEPGITGREGTKIGKGENPTPANRNLSNYIWISLLVLLAAERLLAMVRKQ